MWEGAGCWWKGEGTICEKTQNLDSMNSGFLRVAGAYWQGQIHGRGTHAVTQGLHLVSCSAVAILKFLSF